MERILGDAATISEPPADAAIVLGARSPSSVPLTDL
jgi:hypothetical protein